MRGPVRVAPEVGGANSKLVRGLSAAELVQDRRAGQSSGSCDRRSCARPAARRGRLLLATGGLGIEIVVPVVAIVAIARLLGARAGRRLSTVAFQLLAMPVAGRCVAHPGSNGR